MQVDNNETQGQERPNLVSWFLRKDKLFEREGPKGRFYNARVFNGTKLPDGTDISGYTYTFNTDKLKEIKAYEKSPDFIKDPEFREANGAIYYKEDTKIRLTEPYDKSNPDKELKTIEVEAKVLRDALRNREKPSKSGATKENEIGSKERVTQRAVAASNSKSDSDRDNSPVLSGQGARV